MQARFAGLQLALLAVTTQLWSSEAWAQKPARERPRPTPDEPTVDEMMEELIVPEDEDSDLAWLYSDKVYEPSELGGRPIPAPALPERGEGTPRTWNPAWRRFETGDYVLTGTALATSIGAALIPTSPNRWRGRVGLDESVRKAIGITDYDRGVWARDTSDVLLSFAVTYPLLVDSLIVTYWYRSSEDVATQMALISAEAMSVAAAVQGLSAGLASRERPYVRECGGKVDANLRDCSGRKPYRSFFSGHTSQAFAGASVACSHHIHHRVFGEPFADGFACGTALTVATATGLMRIVGNQHYFTDVAAGATVGLLSGFGIPWLLHYGPLARQNENTGLRVSVIPTPGGLGLGGEF